MVCRSTQHRTPIALPSCSIEESENNDFLRRLSPCDQAVLKGIAQGLTIGQIAENLGLSIKDVEAVRYGRLADLAKLYVGIDKSDVPCLTRFAFGLKLIPQSHVRPSVAVSAEEVVVA